MTSGAYPFLAIRCLRSAGERYDLAGAAAPSPAVPLATVVAEGDPAESLIVAAAQAELLVVGTRGRSPFAGLVLGSVSQRCAAAASCPVVLVKADGEQAG